MVILCERNRTVAELRSLPQEPDRKLRLGVLAGMFDASDDFDEPCEEFESIFYGDSKIGA